MVVVAVIGVDVDGGAVASYWQEFPFSVDYQLLVEETAPVFSFLPRSPSSLAVATCSINLPQKLLVILSLSYNSSSLYFTYQPSSPP